MPAVNDQHTKTPCARCLSTTHGAALFWYPDPPQAHPRAYKLICIACEQKGYRFSREGWAVRMTLAATLEQVKQDTRHGG